MPTGFVAAGADCDDNEARAYPGNPEVCGTIDNDCNGLADDDPTDLGMFYADGDEDGYGDAVLAVQGCDAPVAYVTNDTDCDDSNAQIHPGAAEPDCTDPTDYDCDGAVGYADVDGDGSAACEDCDDTDATRAPFLLSFRGSEASDYFGYSGSLASDLNDDGFDDVVLGAPYADEGGYTDYGAVYVFYGG